jgi:ATP-dependent Lon protease
MGIGQQLIATDLHIEAIDLLSNHVPCEAELPSSSLSIQRSKALRAAGTGDSRRSQHPGQHQIRACANRAFTNRHGQRRTSGADSLENKRHFLEVAGDIVERVDPIFFSDPMTAAMKALGMT